MVSLVDVVMFFFASWGPHTGMLLCSLSFVIAALVQLSIDHSRVVPAPTNNASALVRIVSVVDTDINVTWAAIPSDNDLGAMLLLFFIQACFMHAAIKCSLNLACFVLSRMWRLRFLRKFTCVDLCSSIFLSSSSPWLHTCWTFLRLSRYC